MNRFEHPMSDSDPRRLELQKELGQILDDMKMYEDMIKKGTGSLDANRDEIGMLEHRKGEIQRELNGEAVKRSLGARAADLFNRHKD